MDFRLQLVDDLPHLFEVVPGRLGAGLRSTRKASSALSYCPAPAYATPSVEQFGRFRGDFRFLEQFHCLGILLT